MSSTKLINQTVAGQRQASEHEPARSRSAPSTSGIGLLGKQPQNVGASERKLSLIAGAALFALGLTRGRLTGLTLLGLGGALALRGYTGHCSAYTALGIDTTKN